MYETFKSLGLENFTIHINNRKILNGLFKQANVEDKSIDIMRTIDKIDKIGKETVVAIFKDDFKMTEESIKTIINFIQINGTTDEKIEKLEKLGIENELKQVVKYIRLFNVPDEVFEIDLSIARGLDYYTGTVYETFLNDYKSIGSICSGGRYNDLSEYYTDKKLPGVGMSIGLTRLFFILNDIGLIKTDKKSISKVLVISMIEDLSKAIEVANMLRNSGINTEVYFDNKKIKSKFKYADKLNVPYVIVIGEDEINTGLLTIKNMEQGTQQQLPIDEIIKNI